MREAQAAFDARAAPLCPSQLASPVLHRVLAHPPIQPLIYGGKGVGSQVGGRAAVGLAVAGWGRQRGRERSRCATWGSALHTSRP